MHMRRGEKGVKDIKQKTTDREKQQQKIEKRVF